MLTLEIIIDHYEVIHTDFHENFIDEKSAIMFAEHTVLNMMCCCQLTLLKTDKTIFFKSKGKHERSNNAISQAIE